MMSVRSRPYLAKSAGLVVLAKAAGPQRFRKLQRLWTNPRRIESFKSPLVVVLKHTIKRTWQAVNVDRLLPCNTPPAAVSEVDSELPPDSQTPTDGQDIPDEDSQPLLGIEEDSQS